MRGSHDSGKTFGEIIMLVDFNIKKERKLLYYAVYQPKTFADFAAAASNACFGSLMP